MVAVRRSSALAKGSCALETPLVLDPIRRGSLIQNRTPFICRVGCCGFSVVGVLTVLLILWMELM